MQVEKFVIMDPSDRKFISQNLRVILDNLMEPITSKALLLSAISAQFYFKKIIGI